MRSGLRIVCVALFISLAVAASGQEASSRETLLLTKDISSYVGSNMVLRVRELELAPSSRGQKHRHPGPVVVCVLEGSLEVALEGQKPKAFGAGQCFAEEPHQLHLYSRNLSKTAPVRLVSYLLSHLGEPLSEPQK